MASTAPGLAMRSSAANTCCLIAMSSNTASITISASATAPRSVVPAMRAIRACGLVRGERAARGCAAIMRGHRVEAARERRVVGLDHLHGDAGIGEAHGDAAAHGAGADHRGAPDFGGLGGGDLGKLRRLALGKEDVALRLRLLARDELEKQRALARQRPFDRRRERAAQRLDGRGRRLAAARALQRGGRCRFELFRIGAIRRELLVAAPSPAPADRPPCRGRTRPLRR